MKVRRTIVVNDEMRVRAQNHDTGEVVEGPQPAVVQIYLSWWTACGDRVTCEPLHGRVS